MMKRRQSRISHSTTQDGPDTGGVGGNKLTGTKEEKAESGRAGQLVVQVAKLRLRHRKGRGPRAVKRLSLTNDSQDSQENAAESGELLQGQAVSCRY